MIILIHHLWEFFLFHIFAIGSMAPLRILISGAGIGGNAAAFWLSRLGHHITLIERFPKLRSSGLQVDLRGDGLEVMKRMGLEQQFELRRIPEQGLQIVDKSGNTRAFFPAKASGNGLQTFTTDSEIMRGDLCRLLHDACSKRITSLFGVTIEALYDQPDSINVRLSDGSEHDFDFVVGADGQYSRTRKLMLGPEAPDPFMPLSGLKMAYFTVPKPMKENEKYLASIHFATKGRLMMSRRHRPDILQVYLGCPPDENRLDQVRGNTKAEKDILRDLCQGAGPLIEEAAELMMNADDFYLERIGVVNMDSWSRGRVVLLGDAAYCPSATTGMGTTSAIIGAYILAGEVQRQCKRYGEDASELGQSSNESLQHAFSNYETIFRPFISQVTVGLEEGKDPYAGVPTSAFGVRALYVILDVLSSLRLDRVLGYFFFSGGVKNWALPRYEELDLQ